MTVSGSVLLANFFYILSEAKNALYRYIKAFRGHFCAKNPKKHEILEKIHDFRIRMVIL